MADRERRGMFVKNTGDQSVQISMATRVLSLGPGEERFITAEEVRDPMLREGLQVRTVSIVRPASTEETRELRQQLEEEGEL